VNLSGRRTLFPRISLKSQLGLLAPLGQMIWKQVSFQA
jgi:hypothetical protein